MASGKKRILKISRHKDDEERDRQESASCREVPDLYRELLNNIYDAVLITDSDATVIEVNRRAVEALLYGEDELVGMEMLNIIPDADISFLKTLKKMPASQYALIETRCRRKDGSFYPCEIAVKSIGGRGKNISFFVRNISKRREAESKLRLVDNAVRNSLTAIVITDEKGRIEFANPAAGKIFGPDFDPSAGKEIGDFLQEKEKVRECFERLNRSESWQGEMTVEQGVEQLVNTEVAAVANMDEGKLNGFVFSLLDITNEKAAEKQRQINARNAAAIATLGAACHHLSQPATVLCVNAEIMGSAADDGMDEGLMDLINQNASAASDLQEKLRELNDVTLYKTERYLEDKSGLDDISNTILSIEKEGE